VLECKPRKANSIDNDYDERIPRAKFLKRGICKKD
jgi:hypothetical protein